MSSGENIVMNAHIVPDIAVLFQNYVIKKYEKSTICLKLTHHLNTNEKLELYYMKSLKIPKGQSESVYRRRTDNTMAKRKSTKGQTTINKTYIYNPTKNRG